MKNIRLTISCICIIMLILLALCADYIFADPISGDLSLKFAPPSNTHWLGTDHLGRDILARLGHGAKTSLLTVFAISILIVICSFCVGLYAGYKGGVIDSIFMRICDVFLAFPTFVLALFFIALFGVGLLNVIIAIFITHWAWYARMVRSMVLVLRTQKYILSAKVAGSGDIKILCRHILPHVFMQMIILVTLDLGHMLLHVSGLSFLGLGVQAPQPEWGVMLQDFAPYIFEHPNLIVYPGLCIFITVALFNTFGESLRDAYAIDYIKNK